MRPVYRGKSQKWRRRRNKAHDRLVAATVSLFYDTLTRRSILDAVFPNVSLERKRA